MSDPKTPLPDRERARQLSPDEVLTEHWTLGDVEALKAVFHAYASGHLHTDEELKQAGVAEYRKGRQYAIMADLDHTSDHDVLRVRWPEDAASALVTWYNRREYQMPGELVDIKRPAADLPQSPPLNVKIKEDPTMPDGTFSVVDETGAHVMVTNVAPSADPTRLDQLAKRIDVLEAAMPPKKQEVRVWMREEKTP